MAESRDTALVLAELAHELSQPLTGIRANAELLLEARPSDPAVAARVAVIVRQAERVRLILDRARRQSPPPRGALRADLNLAVEAAWALLEREAKEQGAVLEHDLARDLPAVAAEQVAVEQILGNLLRNALQAVKRGRIRVRTAAAPSGGAEVVVEDDGPGIPAELRSRLFEPFATGRQGGTGLGLRISRALAEEAGGTLEALEGGPGARFRLHLPFAT
jgi:signal transduction histidine kinase